MALQPCPKILTSVGRSLSISSGNDVRLLQLCKFKVTKCESKCIAAGTFWSISLFPTSRHVSDGN